MWSMLIPRPLIAWRQRRRAIIELEQLQQEEEWSLERDEMNPIHRAVQALAIDDRPAALRFWRDALLRYPRFARRSHDSLEILLGLGLLDEAEALAQEGRKREPRSPFYHAGLARIAEHRNDLDKAIRDWKQIRTKFPGYWLGFVRGAACLSKARQFKAAEVLHEKSLELFPDQLSAWLEWARTAENQQDWPEAMRRWEAVRDKFDHNVAYSGIARALEKLGRLEDAEQLITETRVRFPLVVELAVARPRLAYERGHKDEAVAHWAEVQRRFPLDRFGYEGGARLLVELGRFVEAEAIVKAAIQRFPNEDWPAAELAAVVRAQQK